MSSSSNTAAETNHASEDAPAPITFTVKTSKDDKYTLTLPITTSIAEMKSKLADMSGIEADLQRLIYSGRVMKNEQTLEFYKVRSGHTVHLVKGAASNQRAAAGGNTAAAASSSGAAPATPWVPRTIAAGTGNNPLAGLTGARYAGQVPLPNASIFGPDGGMGPPPDAEQAYQIMATPEFQATMNEMLQNPQMLDYIIESNPALRSTPGARELMQTPEFRQMMTNPEMLRQVSALQRGLGGAQASFPAPGVTDTTPASQAGGQAQQQPPAAVPPPAMAANPFSAIFGAPPAAAPGGAQSGSSQPGNAPPQPNFMGLANLFGMGMPPAPPGAQNAAPPPPIDHEALLRVLRSDGQFGGTPPTAGASGPPRFPPDLLNILNSVGVPPQAPVDTRPPEERYEAQLRQLNDMGFFDFDRNVEALRRAGGSVQGAIQQLLGD